MTPIVKVVLLLLLPRHRRLPQLLMLGQPCEEPYDEWRTCVIGNGCTGCQPIPSAPGDWLLPGEECSIFEDWFPVNYVCCPACVFALAEFEECKDCNLPPPTPVVTAPPNPAPTPPEPECKEPYEDWVNCVDDEECDDCDTSIPGRTATEAQTPGANCNAFVPWYLDNLECCGGTCNPALDEFADCKDCDIPIPEEPTAAPSAEEVPPGEIRGFVFVDVNGNGSRDPGEPGIPGVSVVLLTCLVLLEPSLPDEMEDTRSSYLQDLPLLLSLKVRYLPEANRLLEATHRLFLSVLTA